VAIVVYLLFKFHANRGRNFKLFNKDWILIEDKAIKPLFTDERIVYTIFYLLSIAPKIKKETRREHVIKPGEYGVPGSLSLRCRITGRGYRCQRCKGKEVKAAYR
jgi:hypothetical protein